MFERKVFLDTNFLLIPGQFKVDIFSEIKRIMNYNYNLVIVDQTIDELNKLIVLGNRRDREAAKLAYVMIKQLEKQKSLKITACSSKDNVDDCLVQKVSKKDFVATQDKELKSRVSSKKSGIITLKQKKYLVIE